MNSEEELETYLLFIEELQLKALTFDQLLNISSGKAIDGEYVCIIQNKTYAHDISFNLIESLQLPKGEEYLDYVEACTFWKKELNIVYLNSYKIASKQPSRYKFSIDTVGLSYKYFVIPAKYYSGAIFKGFFPGEVFSDKLR